MSEAVTIYRRLGERPARDYTTGAWTRRIRSASLAVMLGGVGAGLIALPFLPAEIPTHFAFSGEADAWGSKWSLLGLLLLWAATQIGLDQLSRRPRLVNYPGPVTSANVQHLYRAGEQMMVRLSASVAVTFVGIVGMTLGLPAVALAIVGLIGTLAATLGGIARLSSASWA